LFEKFLKDNKVVSGLIQNCYKKTYFGGYSYSNVPKSAKIKDKIFVGSAAGFVEAARGFGVSYGINSGLMAAEAIIENKDYDLLWKSSFEKELLKGLKRRFFFEKLNNSDFEKMVLADKAKISKSTKVPFELVDLFEGIAFNKELAKWNNKFSIGRIF
jgi:flavin-dependent dehydrogenase